MNLTENATPQPGKTYAINQKGSDTVVTVVGVTSVAMRCWGGLPSQKWECVEKDGWLGFVSRATTVHDRDTYLGHDGNEILECRQPHHLGWESFQVVLHDEGFAWEIRKDNRLSFIGINPGGSWLELSAKGTTWWGFTVIDGGALGGADGGQPPSYAPLYAPSTRSLSVDTPQMKLVLHW